MLWTLCFLLASFGTISDAGNLPEHLVCEVCEKIVDDVGDVILKNGSETDIEKVLEGICSFFHFEKKPVCVGTVKVFQGEILSVLKHGVLDGPVACGRIFDHCGVPNTEHWTISIPPNRPVYSPPQLPSKGRPEVRVVHLTDPHVDLKYVPGTNAECGMPLCCRASNGPGHAGKWGDLQCDPPITMLESLFQHLAENVPMDYLIMTGDLPAHNIWNQTREDQLHVLSVITDLLRKYLPGVTIYPSLGNHESAPVDSFPPPFIKGSSSNQWLLDGLADAWKSWLPEDALETVRHGGYYAVRRPGGLRIISLNFNYCNNYNFWLLINSTDPAGQLQWLTKQLLDAEEAGEKVHILGHIPPGDSGCIEPWSMNYHRLVTRFQNTIAAQFFGHTHFDELEVFFNEETEGNHANNIAFISPSITTYKGMFPAYRVYDIDGDYPNSSRAVLDHHNYWMNLTEANQPGNSPRWSLAYSAREAYSLPSLFPRDWADFAERATKDDSLFHKYYYHKYHGPKPADCDSSCKKKEICMMLTSESKRTSRCP